ncbi:MAG: hypothetical protein VW576_03090 [Opitutae bacterium]
MKHIHLRPHIILVSLLLSSCDQMPTPSEIKEHLLEQNKSTEIKPDFSVTPEKPAAPVPVEIVKQVKEEPVSNQLESTSEKATVQTKSSPEEPAFSKELLAAVQNWTKVPKSVFPAEPVITSIPVNLVFKSSSGQVMGSSLTPAGSEIQVLGMRGSTLIVANLNNSKLRGEVDVDQTDFKQLLAYRFEINKKNKEARLARQQQESANSKIIETNDEPQEPEILDDIPDPLDFGHGRFCICKDCREKRLAQSGSLKTGFGLEP